MKTFKYILISDVEHDLAFYVSSYTNGNMAIDLIEPSCEEEPHWSRMTVNIDRLMPNYAFVDTNNNSKIEGVLKKYKFAKFTGTTKISGFHEYPLYEFDLKKMKDYIHPESDYPYLTIGD